MATGVTTVKTTGRVVFELVRNGETTTRQIEIPYAKNDAEAVQSYVNTLNSTFTNAETSGGNASMNLAIQPANWRDTNVVEEQWTTTGVHYEIVTTSITPVNPEQTGN